VTRAGLWLVQTSVAIADGPASRARASLDNARSRTGPKASLGESLRQNSNSGARRVAGSLYRSRSRGTHDAQDWYEAEGSALGHRFHAAIDCVVRRMADNPRQFPPSLINTLRRTHAKKFPYALFFLVEPDARQTERSMLFVVTNKFPPVPNNPSRFPLEFQAASFLSFCSRRAIDLGCVCLPILASHQRGRQERQQEQYYRRRASIKEYEAAKWPSVIREVRTDDVGG
jgi:hypothetical protein